MSRLELTKHPIEFMVNGTRDHVLIFFFSDFIER